MLILAVPAVAAPPVLDNVGGNSANGNLLWLDFDKLVAETINTDANERVSLRSFDFFKNTCGDVSVDVIAADTNAGNLVLYPSGQGAGASLCANGGCPARPDGLSSSNERLMSVAEIGTAGAIPAVWFFRPAACDSDGPFPFDRRVQTGQFKVGSSGAATPVEGIADTEFVRVPGGGLAAGDALVLTINPTAIARIREAEIKDLLESEGNDTPENIDILVDQSFFGTTSPTGLAFVPGTAGVGAADTASESEDLLVTLAGGRVLKLTFELSGSSVVLKAPDQPQPGATPLEERIFIDGLGNGPLGIAAGTRNDETIAIVADRQQGRFFRYLLDVGESGELSWSPGPENPKSIASGVQNPQGVAINSDAFDASECSRSNACQIRKSVELLFTQEITSDDNATVFANIFVITDTRDSTGEKTINLSEVSEEFDSKLTIPESCRGFPLHDDPSSSVLLVLDIKKNFDVLKGEWAQVTETVDKIIPELGSCGTTGARLFYHRDPDSFGNFVAPAPENGTLYDLTFFCSNPSRSITPTFSAVAVCTDPFFHEVLAANKTKLTGKLAKTAEAGINTRANNLQQVVDVLLPSTLPSGSCADLNLKATLTGYLDEAKKSAKKDLTAVYTFFDQGALAVFECRNNITDIATAPDTLFADLLSRLVAAAYYSRETISGGTVKYCPPQALLGPDGIVILPEGESLTDVEGCNYN